MLWNDRVLVKDQMVCMLASWYLSNKKFQSRIFKRIKLCRLLSSFAVGSLFNACLLSSRLPRKGRAVAELEL